MSIKYEIQSIKNSQSTGKDRHFARIYEGAPMSASQLESSIESSCSLTKGDVESTLSALREQMLSELSQGNRFYIPNIGYFSLSVDLDMPDGKSVDKARGDYISVRNIKFRPDSSLLQEVKTKAHFERAQFSTKSKVFTEEEMLEKIKEYLSTNSYINRRAMETQFGLRQNVALKWLKHFTEIGVLRKEGERNSPIYFLNNRK